MNASFAGKERASFGGIRELCKNKVVGDLTRAISKVI